MNIDDGDEYRRTIVEWKFSKNLGLVWNSNYPKIKNHMTKFLAKNLKIFTSGWLWTLLCMEATSGGGVQDPCSGQDDEAGLYLPNTSLQTTLHLPPPHTLYPCFIII